MKTKLLTFLRIPLFLEFSNWLKIELQLQRSKKDQKNLNCTDLQALDNSTLTKDLKMMPFRFSRYKDYHQL